MADRIQLRRDSDADWTSNDPTLSSGEAGVVTDGPALVLGDGTTAYSGLEQFTPTQTLTRVKTADESVTSSTTLQDDDDLTVPVLANDNYAFELFLYCDLPGTEDFKFAFTVPSGATLVWFARGVEDAGSNDRWSTFITGSGTSYTPNVTTADWLWRIWGSVQVSTTAGDLTFQFAQGTSGANATTVKSGSWMQVSKQ